MLQTTNRGLSSTALKTIALVLMLLDHIHYFFAFTGFVPELFSMLGRLAAPLFLFCTVEGFSHTSNRKKYIFRIWAIGAGMGLIEFAMMYMGMLRRGDGFFPLNGIFMSLFVLCCVWQGMDWLAAKKYAPGALLIASTVCWPFVLVALAQRPGWQTAAAVLGFFPFPAWAMITDGGWSFLCGGIILYLFRDNRKLQLGVWALWVFAADFVFIALTLRGAGGFALAQMFTDYYEWFGIFAVLLMALYNGQRGSGHKALFYWFYPTHVYLLYALSCVAYPLLTR